MGTPGNGCVLSDVNIHYDRIGYRLPTEAEWEFAYRANTTTDFYWGMTFSDNMTALDSAEFDLYTVWKHNGGACPSPVATKFPNAFGLYDMSGNVVHLCNDWKCAYSSTPLTDPIGAESGTKIVWRGSSFEQPFPVWSTAFARWTGAAPDFKYISIGFRCVIVSK
jgi:formylglycine-generating enzyme required for sulfatase activity